MKISDRINDPAHLAAAVFRYLNKNGLGEFNPASRVFVEGSIALGLGPREPWVDFDIDELRAGRWFRVGHSLGFTAAGWCKDFSTSFPSGLSLDTYGFTPGKLKATGRRASVESYQVLAERHGFAPVPEGVRDQSLRQLEKK